jgi:hypothetical protein
VRVVVALSLCLAACGATATRSRPSVVARAQAAHEYPSPTPPQRTAGSGPSGRSAVEDFAAAYINWSAATVAKDMRALAAHSIGQARAAMQLAAAQTASDYELQRGGIANHGTVEAIAPLRGQSNRYVVVTRELTSASATAAYQGLQAAWHVALATVAREPTGRWVVSGWQPET